MLQMKIKRLKVILSMILHQLQQSQGEQVMLMGILKAEVVFGGLGHF